MANWRIDTADLAGRGCRHRSSPEIIPRMFRNLLERCPGGWAPSGPPWGSYRRVHQEARNIRNMPLTLSPEERRAHTSTSTWPVRPCGPGQDGGDGADQPGMVVAGHQGDAGQAPGGQAGSRLGWPRHLESSLAGAEPPGTDGEARAARWNSTRAAGMRSCSQASRASARASAAVGRFRSRARGHSRA